MKRMKKILAILLAAVMVMSLGSMSVFADDTYSLTITGVATDSHTFSAWQIFAGSVNSAGTTLGDITWGQGVDYTTSQSGKTIYEALAEISITVSGQDVYPFTSTPTQAGGSALTSAAAVAAALDTYRSYSEILDKFIEAITPYLTSATATTSTVSGSAGDYSYIIDVTSYGSGYYLIKDTTQTLGEDDAYTDFIVQILGTQSVPVKSSVPSVTKTVTATGGTTQVDATSASAGETVTFTLTATMPSTYADYSTYKLVFHDNLSTNLTYNDDVVVTVNNYSVANVSTGDGLTGDTYYVLDSNGAYVVTTDSNAVQDTTYYTCVSTVVNTNSYSIEQPAGGDYNLEITINNTNALYDTASTSALIDVDATTTIVVTYTAKVTDGIASGTAETNSVVLEYSNDPNGTSTGKTTEEKVYVRTFDLTINKVDGDNGNTALAGAKFSLYKKVSVTVWDSITYYTISGTTATEVDKTQVTEPVAGTDYYILVKDNVDASQNGTSYTAKFEDLGEGTYALIESVTPAGYNTINAIVFNISATYNADGSVNTLTASDTGNSLTFTPNSDKSGVSTTVENHAGSTIPTTGGIGTTIFYIVGAVLVLGAGVILITRRRMGNRV